MKNIFKATLIGLFMVSCYWLSKQHNDTYAAAPFSNIRTTIVGGGGSQLLLSSWNGPSNVLQLNNSFWVYSTITPASITNVTGVDTNNNLATWATIVISNQGAGDLVTYSTVPFARAIGAQTHNPLAVPPGKVAVWSYLCIGQFSTNFVNSVQDAVSSAAGVSLIAAGTNIFIVTNSGLATISLADPTILNEVDVKNLYGSNAFFTTLTNAVLVSGDANGQLQRTDFTAATNNDTAVSNGLFVLIQNGTNGTSANATNNDLYTSNALWVINNNNSINATNQGTVVSNGVITYINTIGSNDTNNDTVVSNGVVAHTVRIQGTAGHITSSVSTAQPLSANPATVLDLADLSGTYELHVAKLTNSVYGTNIDYTPTVWAGPSNQVILNNGYQTYVTTTPISITNFTLTAQYNQWATIAISNNTSASITGYVTVPFIRMIGAQSTNAMIIPSFKVGIYSFQDIGMMSNCVDAAQQ